MGGLVVIGLALAAFAPTSEAKPGYAQKGK